ncbi:class I SAM-dependent methyltransferase [Collimonas pratensis]|uniref:Tellurite resistance TehB family protein n=1 Tax=Collimonas pratensis TaxID=279113 RepID=A0ABM5Z8A9_9BURK|nr:class I SAM-dependent methyltransferase [Collimonas pratensis]AMP15363.1 tellurite resistance TehB family protein [Collimonas pratensis]
MDIADTFYDDMASAYHLIFADWNVTIEQQGKILSALLPPPALAGKVLDCACGIGTQALGLAGRGYQVEGSDLSTAEVERARQEAGKRGLDIPFRSDDMRLLHTSAAGEYGVVLAFDNALPHLDSDEGIAMALAAMYQRLRPGGKLMLSLRDYGPLMEQRPSMMPPAMFMDEGRRRIVHQVWDWQDERRYVVHLYITCQLPSLTWSSSHFTGHYRALTPQEVASHASKAGFEQVQILQPAASGYYQPIVAAIRPLA